MYVENAAALLEALRSGDITIADLSGEQFQALIFYRLLERCRKSEGYEYDVVDNYHDAVDFVVRERPLQTSKFHAECATHVFECKHYRRTLELSTVAKLLVFGVRFQPTSLNIVSSTSLQPQVYDYARVLFGGLGNEAAMFRNTFFRHYRTSDLLEMEVDPDDAEQEGANWRPKNKSDFDISWEIAECQPFLERIIADSHTSNGTLTLHRRWSYRLKLWLCTAYRPDELRIWVDDLPNGIAAFSRSPEATNACDNRYYLRIVHVLDVRGVKESTSGHIVVHISYKSRSHRVLAIPFSVSFSMEGMLSSDLRKQETDDFAAQLRRRDAPRILLLGGPAGVGKTYFCEAIAEKSRVTDDFDVNRFSADADADLSLLRTMLINMCTPAAARTSSTDEWSSLAATLLKALSPMNQGAEYRLSESEQISSIVPVLAEFMVRAGPRLLVLRDAHLLTERTAREFGALIARLDDLGWGDVYCIVEHRTPESSINIHWEALEAKVKARFNHSLCRHLEPLSAGELNGYLNSAFVHITPELKNAVWGKCGGVPLYLFSLIELLKNQNAIEEDNSGRWRITAPSTFMASTRTNRRSDGVLEERLKGISWEGTILPEEFSRNPLALVAILAIAQDSERVKRLCQLAVIAPEAVESIRRTLIRNNILQQGGEEWAFDFQHDLLRLAAIEVGRDGALQPLIERALAKIQNGDPSVLELELGSDIADWMGLRDDSNRALNAAFERIEKSDNFTSICRILTKLCEGLELGALRSSKNYTSYLACRFSLARATWNNGSLIEARSQYARLASEVSANENYLMDEVTAEASAADAQRRVLGIDLELQDISRFIVDTQHALTLHGSSVVFHSILNRLILYCAEFSHIDFGVELSKLALSIFGDPEPESGGAVICSDIGRLFRSAIPQKALKLYRQGVELACGTRQRLYNEMDVLTTEVLIGHRTLLPEEIQQWRETLVGNGLRGMLLRFDLFCASVALRNGEAGRARRMFQHLETTVAVYKYENFWLPMWNDRLIAALLEDDYEEAELLTYSILDRTGQLLLERSRAMEALFGLRPVVEVHKERFSHLKPLGIRVPPQRPTYSGVLMQVMLNLEALSKVMSGTMRTKLGVALDHWPADVDHAKALCAFSSQPAGSIIKYKGQALVLCSQ